MAAAIRGAVPAPEGRLDVRRRRGGQTQRSPSQAAMRGTTPPVTAMDLIVEDRSRIGTVYFSQSEDVVRRAIERSVQRASGLDGRLGGT